MDLGLIFEQSGSNSATWASFSMTTASKFVPLYQGLAEDGTTSGSISLNNYALTLEHSYADLVISLET